MFTDDVYKQGHNKQHTRTFLLSTPCCRYYHPKNLTISIVGDITPDQVHKLADKYFGGWSPGATAVTLKTEMNGLANESLPRPQVRLWASRLADHQLVHCNAVRAAMSFCVVTHWHSSAPL